MSGYTMQICGAVPATNSFFIQAFTDLTTSSARGFSLSTTPRPSTTSEADPETTEDTATQDAAADDASSTTASTQSETATSAPASSGTPIGPIVGGVVGGVGMT